MIEPELYDSEEEETLDGLYDGEDDADAEADDDDNENENEHDQGDHLLDNIGHPDAADDATEDGDDDSGSDDSEEDDEEEDEDEEEEDEEPSLDLGLVEEGVPPGSSELGSNHSMDSRSPSALPAPAPSPPRKRSFSPAHLRRNGLAFSFDRLPRSYTVEAICAIPHPVPTHALAGSACFSHLLTGSDDGYIRDYDIFSAVNGKNFLTAPQRHHANVVEGLMKSGQLRFWWENTANPEAKPPGILSIEEEATTAPVYSLAMQSDALWALAGTDAGYINLFTVRHQPGQLQHVLPGHRGPVSALALDYDEKSVFSAGWDGEAIQWDLNTGQNARTFTAHNSQLSGIALRPASSGYVQTGPAIYTQSNHPSGPETETQKSSDAMNVDPPNGTEEEKAVPPTAQSGEPTQTMTADSDARSDASFDPLFDDVPEEEEAKPALPMESMLAIPSGWEPVAQPAQQPSQPARPPPTVIPPPKGAPPLFDPVEYSTYSPDLLMTAFIDGQILLWDRRVHTNGRGVGRLWMSEKTPPWCLSACWSADGAQIFAGRRNGTVDVWDVRVLGQSGPTNTPRLLKTLRNPASSGVVSCVVAFPDCRHMACASVDNIRLWNVTDSGEDAWGKPKSGVPFKIIPGHHGGYISQMIIDPGARFMVSASSNRGWYGDSTRTVFVHDIKRVD
ncbi:Transcription factor SPT8 [Psilocybe cubensis]|uniref:Transcription factor spt8 beta-propeller domain-containing protein n=2 Tax=Psilocybe cubensis TaxID=181762 RepID=A0A8H8CNG6_PSICU|nr:Transcription factor SPT8 [Psilocybe cubensis]KAH9484354.1 Transcription factor SPT8 [Psilocybe cubensis]